MATNNDKNIKDINLLDKISKKILSTIDNNYSERELLNKKDLKFKSIVDRELATQKGMSNGNILDFAINQFNSGTNKKNSNSAVEVDQNNIFTQNVGDIFNYFQDVYKNRYIEMADLKLISRFVPAIGEAVKTTLDNIVSADNISSSISRSLKMSPSISPEDQNTIITEIERIEKEERLLPKLKNIVYKKTLVTGRYFVYAVPYSKIFNEFEHIKSSGQLQRKSMGIDINKLGAMNNTNAKTFNLSNESISTNIITTESYSDIINDYKSELKSKPEVEAFKEAIENHMGTVEFVGENIQIMTSVLESVDTLSKYKKAYKENTMDDKIFSEGSYGTKSTRSKDLFKDTTGTYLKFIESKNVIPIKVFNQVVGYYHIHSTTKKKKRPDSVVGSNNPLFTSANFTTDKKEEIMNKISDTISDGIMKNFTHKFVETNLEHKKLIADCIIANGIIDNDYRIQFIPADQMVEFIINPDENDEGESILADSLYPAKLLLSLLICKMLNYMNKSGNKTYAHISKGPIDLNNTNQIQRVVRNLQDSNITMNDLLSSSLIFSKMSRDTNIALPTARDGKKLVEFEVQEGQNIDLKTDFENMLEDMAIIGTGVPSVLMDYVNQVDYAKQITSANIKFAGRVSSLDSDLENGTTRLYKILIENSKLPDELKTQCLSEFEFVLIRPKALAASNNSDYMRTVLENANTIADILIGQSNLSEPKNQKIKDGVVRRLVRSDSQFLPWDEYDKILESVKLEVAGEEEIKDSSTSSDDDLDM